jgi:uncharacterized membrane protein YfcA
MIELELWQWGLALLGAFCVGFAKTGVGGVGILAVAIFANILPAKQAVGVVLPLLLCADVVAVLAYRSHAQWHYLWRLFPWTAVGVVGGFLVMGRVGDSEIGVITGVIVLALAALHVWRVWIYKTKHGQEPPVPNHPAFGVGVGVAAGFTTMVSNAAGPIMVLYLLAMRLPKMAFMGTSAVYFLLINAFKVPFGVNLGIIHVESLWLNFQLMPMVIVGALLGRLLLQYINQRLFERLALLFTLVAAVRLLASSL